jgi:hypothetical protein
MVKTEKTPRRSNRRAAATAPPIMSQVELAKLGGGQVAYIKRLTSEEALRLYPAVKGLPRGINLYALHAADGTPLALTDSRQAAIGQAIDDKLEIAGVH